MLIGTWLILDIFYKLIMKVVVANQVIPDSHYVYDINLIQMAYGIASLGHKVTIIGLQGANGKVPQEEIDEIYGVEPNVKWIQLGTGLSRWLLTRNAYIFSWIGYRYARKLKADCVYARDYLFPWFCARAGIPTLAESHTSPDNMTPEFLKFIQASQLPAFKCWATMSDYLAQAFHKRGAPKEKLLVLPNGVDVKKFNRPAHLPPSPYSSPSLNVVYTGRLVDDNGIPSIVDAAKLLPHVHFHLVGGSLDDISRHKKRIEKLSLNNVTLHGIQKHSKIPVYLWHADILLLSYSANHPNDAWACPLKMGEYLASGTPILAADTRMLRNWLTDEEVVFVKPDDGKALVNGILYLLSNKVLQKKMISKCLVKASKLSYKERARRMLGYYIKSY